MKRWWFICGLGLALITGGGELAAQVPVTPEVSPPPPAPYYAIGFNLARTIENLALGGMGVELGNEISISKVLSLKIDVYTAWFSQLAAPYYYGGAAMSLRWYLLGLDLRLPAAAAAGLFAQLGVGAEFGSPDWPNPYDTYRASMGLVYGLGWKLLLPGNPAVYIEPMLGYRSSLGTRLGSGFYGGLGLGLALR
jgi:hypothetical protein